MNKTKKNIENFTPTSPNSLSGSKVFLEALKALQSKNLSLEHQIANLVQNEKTLKTTISQLEEKLFYLRSSSKTLDTVHEKLFALAEQLSFTKEELSRESNSKEILVKEKKVYKNTCIQLRNENEELKLQNKELKHQLGIIKKPLKSKMDQKVEERQIQLNEYLKDMRKVNPQEISKKEINQNLSKYNSLNVLEHSKGLDKENAVSKPNQSKDCHSNPPKFSSRTRKAFYDIMNQNIYNEQPKMSTNRQKVYSFDNPKEQEINFKKIYFENTLNRDNTKIQGNSKESNIQNKKSIKLFRIDSSIFDTSEELEINEVSTIQPKYNSMKGAKEPGKVRKRCQSLVYRSNRN